MKVTLFFVRTDENPDYEFRLYEAVDESDFGWDSRNGDDTVERSDQRRQHDRSDELLGYFEDEKYPGQPDMWRVVNFRCSS